MAMEGVTAQSVLEWSLPVVHDCLHEFYGQKLPGAGAAARALAKRHFALWSALVDDVYAELDAHWEQLDAQTRALRLDPNACRAADRYVAAEVLDLSLRRFRRMPEDSRINNAALLSLLTRLQQENGFRMAPAAFARAA